MSCSVFITGLMDGTSEDYQKHLEVASVCLRNGVSVPEETEKFFNPTGLNDDLNDMSLAYALEYIKDGIRVNIDYDGDPEYEGGAIIDLKDIPEGVTRIKVEYC